MRPKAYVRNAADEEQVSKAAKKEQYTEEQFDRDLSSLLELPAGRRVFWECLVMCGVSRSVMRATPHDTAFAAGQQEIGHKLLQAITDAHPDAYFQMLRDHSNPTA